MVATQYGIKTHCDIRSTCKMILGGLVSRVTDHRVADFATAFPESWRSF